MRSNRSRLTATALALLALVTLMAASFGHIHGAAQTNSDASSPDQKLECRLPFSALASGNSKDCPPLEDNHIHCGTCLAANTSGHGVVPDAPQILKRLIVSQLVSRTAYETMTLASVLRPFQARAPPLV